MADFDLDDLDADLGNVWGDAPAVEEQTKTQEDEGDLEDLLSFAWNPQEGGQQQGQTPDEGGAPAAKRRREGPPEPQQQQPQPLGGLDLGALLQGASVAEVGEPAGVPGGEAVHGGVFEPPQRALSDIDAMSFAAPEPSSPGGVAPPPAPLTPQSVAEAAPAAVQEETYPWKLDVKPPRIFLIQAAYHIGVTVNTSRLCKWLWNVRFLAMHKRLEHTDHNGNHFVLWCSGKVVVGTRGMAEVSERHLRKASRCFARMVQRALACDKEYAGPLGASLPNPDDVMFLGYHVTNMWAKWQPTELLNITKALHVMQDPKLLSNGITSSLGTTQNQSFVAVNIMAQKLQVNIHADGLFHFVRARSEEAVYLTAATLHDIVVKPQLLDQATAGAAELDAEE